MFSKCCTTKDGLQYKCKQCQAIYKKEKVFSGDRPTHKVCRVCGEEKPSSQFCKSKRPPDGLDQRCKLCKQTQAVVRYHKDPDKVKSYQRAWRASHPENRRAIARRTRRKHLHEDVLRVMRRTRMLKAAPGSHTRRQWIIYKILFGRRCACCGVHEMDAPTGRLTRDHVVPIRLGGSNYISNIQPLCIPCNVRKGNRSTDYRPTGALRSYSSCE